jgi:type 1 glutamine amidotransferase
MNPSGGSAGSGMPTGGAGGTDMPPGGMGGAGGAAPTGPYAPRSGPFKMLVYSKVGGFQHDSIPAGKTMLQQIANEQGFEATLTEANDQFNAAGLGQYEIVFFMNTTGNILTATEKQAFEMWMTTKNGAFAGVHSATDTENGWAFYSEVTGQYYDLHDTCCSQANIQWDSAALNFVAVRGLPNPWPRSEEWYKFNQAGNWSAKPGFKILSRVTTTGGGTRPVSFVREWGNFRSFYTSLGHQPSTFQDANVKKHIAAGILWAVRREHLVP